MGLRLFLFGPMRAYAGDAAIKLPPRSRLLSLWGYLLLHRHRPTPRNVLAFTFWPDDSEAESRLNLRRHLHRLLHLLPPADPAWILSDRSTLQWNPSGDVWLDVAEFEQLSSDPERLVEAIDLYGGDLLEGVYDDWVFPERERLRELYLQDLYRLVEQAEAVQDYRQAILYAQRLLRHDPLREETYRTLMRLHAHSGDRAGLVRYFNACITVLQRELNVEPSAETRRAYEAHLASQTPAGDPPPPPPRTGPPLRHNLPAQLTSFVGRDRELETVRDLLARARVLTLTGIGGVGKTRLAHALASRTVKQFPEGTWWVDLAPLADPSLLGQAVASALGLREQSTRPIAQALADAVRSKEALVVLDSCEHLVAECADLVEGLLSVGQGVKFLATSTEPLGVPGEVVWQVPPLSLPDPIEPGDQSPPEEEIESSSSVRLFADRAAAALPTFVLTPGNLPSVVRLCRALDGIPLALELAAARLKMLSAEQLVERLDDRFRLLTGGSRSALPRHRTLRAVLDWSYGLLSETERALFRRLSLFVGGFTLESAEAVCAGQPAAREQVLELLSELVDKSLVMVSRADPSRVRYGLLETVGHYARERLIESGEADRLRRAFQDHWVALVQQAGDRLLRGPDQEKWFWIIEQEYANLRSTLSYAEGGGDVVTLARIAGQLWPFWWTRGLVAEGRRWLESILPRRADLPEDLQADILHAAGRLMVLQGDYEQAGAVLEENVAVCRRLGRLPGIADALSSLGVVASSLQDYDRADRIWAEALQVYEAQNDRWGVARALNNLGDLAVYRADYRGAIERLQKSVDLFRELGSSLGESISLINLGRASLLLGEALRAADYFRQSLHLKVALADKEGIAWNLEGLAGVAGAEGMPDRAACLFGAAQSLRKAIGIPLPAPDLPLYEKTVAQARRSADPARWETSWAEGAAMDADQSLAYALAFEPA